MSAYEPGTVAMVAYDGNPERLMLRVIYRDTTELAWVDKDYKILDRHDRVQSVRPLVTLDPKDARCVVIYLRLAAQYAMNKQAQDNAHRIADQIEAQSRPPKPPKPEEPTGLGAVVEDAEGVRWVRTHGVAGTYVWQHDLHAPRAIYSHIDAVRVLSEGVA